MNPAAATIRQAFAPLWLCLLAACRVELARGKLDPLRTVALAVDRFEAACVLPLARREVYIGLCLRAYPAAHRQVRGL